MNLSRFDLLAGLLLIPVIAVLPFLTHDDFYLNLATLIMIWSIFAVGFDFVFGSLGMVSFGHASFLGIGGYAVALGTQRLGLPFEAGVLLAMMAAAACAWLYSFLPCACPAFSFRWSPCRCRNYCISWPTVNCANGPAVPMACPAWPGRN